MFKFNVNFNEKFHVCSKKVLFRDNHLLPNENIVERIGVPQVGIDCMDAGGLPVFSSANQAHQLNNNLHLQQQQQRHLQQQQQQQNQQQHQLDHLQQQGLVGQEHSQYHSTDSIPPKRVDRFRRRIEGYRRRQTDCEPRFEQTFSGVCEQQNIETTVLQKRFLESKAKRAAKKTDKKPDTTLAGNLQSSVLVQQKFLKRPADDVENGPDGYEPPHKLQHNGELTKFSVEIVQQLEFTTSAANSQPQQISTNVTSNVTVKALTNTSVKSEVGQNQNNGSSTGNQNTNNNSNASHNNQRSPQSNLSHDIGHLVECKQEPDHDFADLEAAFEKDAAANGLFKGLSDIIGDATNDESDTFKELISDLSDFHPELLDFEEKPLMEIKTEDGIKQEMISHSGNDGLGSKGNNNSMPQYPSQFNESQMKRERGPYNTSNGSNTPMSEMSPAAQTLKHMAEQHQHKNAMGMGYHPRPPQSQQVNPNRSGGYSEFGSFNGPVEYMNCATNNPGPFHKNSGGPGFDIKQEMMYSQQIPNQGKMGSGGPYSKQQYSPYGSPGSISNHGSPGPNYMPPRGPGPGGPSRPPSGANTGGQGATTLQMKQTQQLHISQQGPGHGIQVSAGQQVHLSGDLSSKGNVSVAAQQGVYFHQQQQQQQQHHQQQQQQHQQQQQQQQHQQPSGNTNNQHSNGPPHSQTSSNESYTVSQSQTINFTQQNVRQRQQQQQQQQNTSSGDVGSSNINPNMSGPNMSGPNMTGPNIPGSNMSANSGNMSSSNPTNINPQSGNQHPPGMTNMSQSQHISAGLGPSTVGLSNPNAGNNMGPQRLPQNPNTASSNLLQSQSMANSMGIGQNMGAHMGPQGPSIMSMNGQSIQNNGSGMPNMGQGGIVPNTINSNSMGAMMPNNMGSVPVNMRHEQAKFIQQQQMMRAQAMQQQQQQQQQHMVGNRPPPPEYKASQAQMIQAQMMQQSGRFPNASAATMRRIGQQPIPPTSQMMRPQHSMYMQHPVHGGGGQRMGGPFGAGGGQRPPNVQVGPEGMPMGSQDWRHLVMTQQQNMSFSGNGMRPGFNPNHQPAGFGMTNTGGPGMQMTPTQMQQQMLRNQQQQQQQHQQSNLQNQSNNQNVMQQILAQQQQQQQQQQQMSQMHLAQTQTLTMQQQQPVMSSFSQTQTQQHSTSQQSMMVANNSQQNETNSLIASATNNADFNDFFENLPVGDTSAFLEQDFLNSLENIQDILQ